MKKIMFMLAFVSIGLFASASNEVKKEKITIERKNTVKAQTKLFTDICLSFEVWTTECPDGSIGLVAIDVYVLDCNTGQPTVGATVYSASLNEACGD
jgi:hypothetical protein